MSRRCMITPMVATVGFHKFETMILPPNFHRTHRLPRLPNAFLRVLG